MTTSPPTPSTGWHKTIWVCLLGWVVTIFGVNIISDNIWGVLFFVSWFGLPIAIFQDARTVREYTDWPHYTWAYLIGSVIWFVSILVGSVYLIQRYEKVSQPAIDTSQSDSGESDQINNEKNTQYKSDNQREGLNAEQGQSDHSLDDIRKKAERKVVDSINAKESGDIDSAIELLNDSIDQYEQLKQKANSNDETRLLEEIEGTVQLAKKKRNNLDRSLESQSELADDLERAERYLQTAFVAHLEGEDTLANLRYRQARERYQSALETYENKLQHPIESLKVSIHSEKEISKKNTSELFNKNNISQELIDNLAVVQDPSDLLDTEYNSEAGESVMLSINNLKSNSGISDKLIHKLKLIVYYTDGDITIDNKEEIKFRCDFANNGYQITNTNA